MASPVNLDNFRAMTGNDPVLEAELFGVFLHSSQECIENLRSCHASGDSEAWRKQSHALKGICLNLGADFLGDLCKKSQELFMASPEEKAVMLACLEDELGHVQAFLENVLTGARKV